jgi:hypothetical protein
MARSPHNVEKDIVISSKFNEVYEDELSKSEITAIKS